MRTSAERDSGQPPRTHVCRGYARPDEFADRARRYLVEGLASGERVLYVGLGGVDALLAELRAHAAFDEGLRRDAVRVASVDDMYATGAVIDPEEQVRVYAAATEEALAAGFTGLRVAAQVIPLVRTPAQLDAFARYEFLADRFMASHAMSAMCAYDVTELGEEVVGQLACPHSLADLVPFTLHGHTRDDSAAALDGQLDVEAAWLWPLALERADLRPSSERVVIDAAGLEFVDHRNLLVVEDYANRHGTTVVLRSRSSSTAHLVDLLGLTGVRLENG